MLQQQARLLLLDGNTMFSHFSNFKETTLLVDTPVPYIGIDRSSR